MYYYRRSLSKHFLAIIPVFIIAIAVGTHLMKSYITGLYSITVEQMSSFSSDIRYQAIKFFTNQFQPSSFSKIFGNGFYTHETYSEYFNKLHSIGFFTEDIGLIGFWTHFGLFGVVAWLLIFKKVFFHKTNDNNIYISKPTSSCYCYLFYPEVLLFHLDI